MTDWTETDGVRTEWFGNPFGSLPVGLLLEEPFLSNLLVEDGRQLLLED